MKQNQEPQLKGTLAAVLVLAVILAASWTAVFVLFINR
ncbi:cytochrome c oxidase subunit 2A [Paenibacillus sambharensis]|uniref:Cytochrome c oxidase subunit 2A n=1 Tax=Paenibacillus sambharensis TaxID=1803190 RepID=A0A2W1LAF5_9BACL|nr:cytochrome c oxidase subunit 2A [Paenibacillus sambharensis]PZD95120.1 cytochrome c oxidase subunit 2A [Paenibacillus sambharensis]